MDINYLVNILNIGELAVIPTDTVYGLVADATNIKAIKRIYDIKKREKTKPLLILVSNLKMLQEYVEGISALEWKIIEKFWPGPLTIIFSKKKNLDNMLTANKEEIAIRMPNNKELLELINKLNKPIIATSANISHQKTITSIDLLEDSMKNELSYIYDGGYKEAIPSTIIKFENNKIIFIRDGLLSKKIKNFLKEKTN